MTDHDLFNYWQNLPPSPFTGMVEEVMKQILEHRVTRGEIKDMESAGFHLEQLKVDEQQQYYIARSNHYFPTGYVKIFYYPHDAWQDAWIDYAIHDLIPKSLERKETK